MTARGTRPRRRYRATLLAALTVALLSAACGTAGSSTTPLTLVPVQGGSLTVGIDGQPVGCNPNALTGTSWASRLILEAVLPSVFTVNPNGQSTGNQNVVPQAELISTSPQTVVYTIDARAKWSDGVPITADDFRYAWEQQRGVDANGLPVVQDASVLGYRDIKSLTATNHGKTVTVVFKQPYADWQMLFDPLVPAHIMEKVGWNPACPVLDPAIDLSGSAYQIHSVSSQRVVLTLNPRWWGPPPSLTKVVVRLGTDAAQLARWLSAGVAQVVIPSAPTPAFVARTVSDPTASSELDVSSTFLQLEFATAGPNTASADQRNAIAHAVNRQALVNSVTGWIDGNIVPSQSHLYVQSQSAYPTSPSTANSANNFVGVNDPSSTTTTNPTPGSGAPFPTTSDLAETDRLMLASGYVLGNDGHWQSGLGVPLVLRLAVDASDSWAWQSGEELADQLDKAGFRVQTLAEPTTQTAGTMLASGQADLAILPFDASPYPSRAVAWYTPSLGTPGENGSANWPNLDDPTVNSLLSQAEQQLNPVKAEPIYAQVDQQLWTDMVALPLFAEPGVLGWSVHTDGVTTDFHGPSLLSTLPTWQLRLPESAATAGTGTAAG